jgi:hypothetical protein
LEAVCRRGQDDRRRVRIAAQLERQALILEVDEERAIVLAPIGVTTAGSARIPAVAGVDFLFGRRPFARLFGTTR